MLTSSKSYGECWSPVDSIRSWVKLAKPPFQEPQKIRTRQVTASAENDNCRLCQPPQMLKVQRRKPACEQTHKKINNKNKKEVFFYACFWLVLSSITTQAAHMSYEHAWDIPGMLRHPKDIPRTRCATRAHPRSNFGKHADVKKNNQVPHIPQAPTQANRPSSKRHRGSKARHCDIPCQSGRLCSPLML